MNEGSVGLVAFTNQHDVSTVDQAAGFTYSYYYLDASNNQVFIGPQRTANASVTVPGSVLSQPGPHTIYGQIYDKDAGFNTYSTTIQVRDVAPIVTLPSSATANQSAPFTLAGSFIDPGSQEGWTATVNYGDGSGVNPLTLNPNNTFTLSHTYATATPPNTPYIVTVVVTEGAAFGSLSGTGTMAVTVQAAAAPPSHLPSAATAQRSST